ncbi:MAG TPA: exodeoxyribonuclease VII large subunit [Bacilli bacterium]|nr:exodeoxyribonuclease VII large subunit [Bacilli bacterium]
MATYLTISEINHYLKSLFDKDQNLNRVYLKGEISNFKSHTRGHLYFTIKDELSRINAVMFMSAAKTLDFVPEDGMNVLLEGRISIYEATGNYQIYVEKMSVDGVGNLYLEFEKLKAKLAEEGLFDPQHKRLLPKYPQRIGIITAQTGAAVKDIISTIKRRYPICETILFPTLVQGEGAKENIVKQLTKAQAYDLDLIICGRGGGSIEDLWAFNEEIVARAIYNSKIPVISAVGHEIDFTIADFVADLRAPTPTGAAEMAVPSIIEVKQMINQYQLQITKLISNNIKQRKQAVNNLSSKQILKNPLMMYEVKEQKLDNLIDQLNKRISYQLQNTKALLKSKISILQVLNPLKILAKGYSIIESQEQIINSTKQLKIDDMLNIKLYQGQIKAQVKELTNNE